ncbi:MAG: leucyl aminopeptidase, partial [Brevundimonas sp.]
MKVEFVAAVQDSEVLAVLVHDGRSLSRAAAAADQASGGAVARALTTSRFNGKTNSTLVIAAPSGVKPGVLVLTGAGAEDAFDDLALESAAGAAYHAVKTTGAKSLTIDVGHLGAEQAARVAFAVRLAAYRFDKYRTTQKPDAIPSIEAVQVVTEDLRGAEAAFEALSAVADGVIFARDLVSEPANILYPAEFARRVKAMESLGLEVEILGEAEMEKLGMRT